MKAARPLLGMCRKCAKPLPDLPWCPTCYEPVCQFAARAPLHHGDFVGSPMPTSGHIPHWSRWEKSATTFGPTGGVVAMVILLSTLLPANSYSNLVYVLTFPVAAAVVLNATSAKGWVVPDEPDLPPLPVDEPPHPPEPLTGAMRAWRIATWTLGLGALLLFALRTGSRRRRRCSRWPRSPSLVVLPGVHGSLIT